MRTERTFLNPARPLVGEVVETLCTRVRRTAERAYSLRHVTVVVPTAQAGRTLRLALARTATERGWGGILPPRVVEPMALVKSAETEPPIASKPQLRAAFVAFVEGMAGSDRAAFPLALGDLPHLFRNDLQGDFRAELAFFDQLSDIWRILAGGGLAMADVPAVPAAADVLAAATGDEAVRWQELKRFEEGFFAYLHAHGLRHEAEDVRRAKTRPQPLEAETEEVVLPALADPVSVLYNVLEHQRDDLRVTVLIHAAAEDSERYDAWGRPVVAAWTGARRPALAELGDADILRAATDAELARTVAADFPPPAARRRRPSLGLCDAALYPELAGAFLNAGYELHNPARNRLAVSSLGRILAHLIELYAARAKDLPWKPFAALFREDDALRRLTGGAPKASRKNALAGLDIFRNAFLPSSFPQEVTPDLGRLMTWERPAAEDFVRTARALVELLCAAWTDAATPASFLRRALAALYAGRTASAAEGEKEFQAAAAAVRDVLDTFEDPSLLAFRLNEGATLGLLRTALAEAAYALEPEGTNAIRTEGWLELVWSAADKVALVGFTEGAVPDSVVGHPFVPDTLRAALGLTTNARRLARDTMLLTDIVRARAAAPGSVRAYFALSNAAGDLRRPSRLLFLVEPDALAGRVRTLFGELPPGPARAPRRLDAAWRPRLPLEDVPLPGISPKNPEGRLSASAIDTWLKCPFTYLFQYGLGMQRVREKDELEANDFGTLIHRALEGYAREQLTRTKDGLAQLHEVDDIAASLKFHLDVLRREYGTEPALKIRLQLDAAEGRLLAFAPLQAKWASEGWRIAADPEFGFNVRPFAGEGAVDLPFKGSVDRIDFKEGVGYRLIDYKTWDKRDGATGRIFKGGAEEMAQGERLRLPMLAPTTPKGTPRRFLSVQLLLYAHCLACAAPETFRDRIADCCYVLLGCAPEHVVVLGSFEDQGPFEANRKIGTKVILRDHLALALDTARTAIRRIRAGIFWPPGPGKTWKYDIREILSASPERDFPRGTPWRDRQERLLDGLRTEEGSNSEAAS